METLTLAAISLSIAVSLMISKNKTPLHLSFAWLCLALFVYKGANFFDGLFQRDFLKMAETLALLTLPPLSIAFTRITLNQQTFLSKRHTLLAAFLSFALAVVAYVVGHTVAFSSGAAQACFAGVLHGYVAILFIMCYLALIFYLKSRAIGAEKKRMSYLAIACTVTAVIMALDYAGMAYGFSLHSNIILAALIYLILMVITHPQLTALHDIMARAMVVFIMTCFAAIIFVFFTGLFGKATAPFSYILVASFIIVISIEPFRQILKKIITLIYPDSPDVFTSLYALDERLEREKSQLLEEMAPVLAHEIRNPLGSMKGAAQYLRSEEDNEEHQKLLDVIIEEVDRLNSVVSQFLNYAKPYQLHRKIQMLNPLVEKAISIVRASHLPENMAIEQELRPDLPLVHIDAEQLIQVILNIAYNAIEAMPEGGTLMFRTSKIAGDAGAAVGLSIRDTGKGVKREDVKNIFKPFFTTKERGVGLGLAICQRIIRSHGGRLRVKSIPGQGTIFYIRLDVVQG
jgi:two-component system, NtrC family, sensor histidine kinase HydH